MAENAALIITLFIKFTFIIQKYMILSLFYPFRDNSITKLWTNEYD